MLTLIDLYEGEVEAAASRMGQVTQALRHSPVLSIQGVRVWARNLQGIVDMRTGKVEHATRMARLLEREGVAWASAMALCLRAGMAPARERPEVWRRAADALTACGLHNRAAGARWCAGDAASERWLVAQGARNPRALVAMATPTLPD